MYVYRTGICNTHVHTVCVQDKYIQYTCTHCMCTGQVYAIHILPPLMIYNLAKNNILKVEYI